jgi:transposase
MRLVLQGIYQWKDVEVAKKLFGNWCAWVKAMREQAGELLEPKARAARMVEGHMEGILAHWTRGMTTAFMEGLNSLFSAMKRKSHGSDGGIHDRHALLRRWETHPPVLLTL